MENDQESGYVDDMLEWPIGMINLPDIWDYIFKHYLTSATDRSNLLLASTQYFGPLLEKHKCSFLFGEVLHVLHNHKYLDISKAELLEYRGGSKSCRESMDRSILLRNPCYQNLIGMDHDIGNPFHVCWIHKPLEAVAQRRFQHLVTLMQDENGAETSLYLPDGNLSFSESNDLEGNRRNPRLILSTAGSRIYHFTYIVRSNLSPWTSIYEFLSEILHLMPNLRSLELIDLSGKQVTPRLSFRCQGLPNMNSLTTLKMKNFPAVIINALVEMYSKAIQNLSIEIDKSKWERYYWYDSELLAGVTNLSHLSLGVMYSEDSVRQIFNGNVNERFLNVKSLSFHIEQCKEERTSTVLKELCDNLKRHFDESFGPNTQTSRKCSWGLERRS